MKNKYSKFGDIGIYLSLLVRLGGGMVLSLLFCCWIGLKADHYFELEGKGILVFMFLGLGIGFYDMFRQVSRCFEKDVSEKEDDLDGC